MTDDLRGHKPDAKDVRITIISREPQPFGKVSTDDVPVEQRHAPPVLDQKRRKRVCGGGLARGAEPSEPDAEALAVARRSRLGQDGSRFRAR